VQQGATDAWNAAMMRPDLFTAVFCFSVPYFPRGERFLHVPCCVIEAGSRAETAAEISYCAGLVPRVVRTTWSGSRKPSVRSRWQPEQFLEGPAEHHGIPLQLLACRAWRALESDSAQWPS
jgi:hypothetical protein